MTKKDFEQSDLDEFFILDSEDHSMFLHTVDEEWHEFKKGIDGAEIFTRDEIKDLLNQPENEGLDIDVIPVKDAFEMEDEPIEDYLVYVE